MTSIVLSRFRPDARASGAALRNWQNIRALARLGPVDVASIGVAPGGVVPVEGVREWRAFPLPPRSARDRLSARSWILKRGSFPGVDVFHLDAVMQWIADRSARRTYDFAVVEGIALAAYVPGLKRLAHGVVFDAHNVESALCRDTMSHSAGTSPTVTRRLRAWIVQRRLAEVERRAVMAADIVWACSDRDARLIRRELRPTGALAVVPNGVDVDAYCRPTGSTGQDWSSMPVTLVYPGWFSYSPNEDAALRLVNDVLPAVRALGWPARAVLVGRDPTVAMIEAARRDPAIDVTGAVDSVVPYLHQPGVVTLPIRLGGGTRLKIAEAFAAGSPVVSTAKGAEGMAVADGEHLLLREEAEAMARAAVDVWQRADLRATLCGNAMTLVRSRYSWEAAAGAIARSLGAGPAHFRRAV